MSTATLKRDSHFGKALASVETRPLNDQAALFEVVNKRIAAARRAEMVRETAEAREDFRGGKVSVALAPT